MASKSEDLTIIRIALRDIAKLEVFCATLTQYEQAWIADHLPEDVEKLPDGRVERIKREYQFLRAKTAFCVKQQGYTYFQMGTACSLAFQRMGQFASIWRQYLIHWRRHEFTPYYPILTWFRAASAERALSGPL